MWQILFLRICYSKSAPCEHSRIVPQNQNLYYKYTKGFHLTVKQLCVKTSVWHHVLLNIRKMLSGHAEISDPLNYTVLTAVYTSLYLANRAAAIKLAPLVVIHKIFTYKQVPDLYGQIAQLLKPAIKVIPQNLGKYVNTYIYIYIKIKSIRFTYIEISQHMQYVMDYTKKQQKGICTVTGSLEKQ